MQLFNKCQFVTYSPEWDSHIQSNKNDICDFRDREIDDIPTFGTFIGVLTQEQSDVFDAMGCIVNSIDINDVPEYKYMKAYEYIPDKWYITTKGGTNMGIPAIYFVKRLKGTVVEKKIFGGTMDAFKFVSMYYGIDDSIDISRFTWSSPESELGFYHARLADLDDINKIMTIINETLNK
jgi:hypothetical protein